MRINGINVKKNSGVTNETKMSTLRISNKQPIKSRREYGTAVSKVSMSLLKPYLLTFISLALKLFFFHC